jgi:hypothetical protein
MIHEGTHGIQALDLLGRKVRMEDGRGLSLLAQRMQTTVARARAVPTLAAHAQTLARAIDEVADATRAAWADGDPVAALANAVPYLQALGHTVLAWIWLDVALAAVGRDDAASRGRLQACRYFFHYELPKIGPWLQVVRTRDSTCAEMPEDAF